MNESDPRMGFLTSACVTIAETADQAAEPGRGPLGRFTAGNRWGVSTRFQPGRTGNPRGRPPKVSTCYRRLRDAGHSVDVLRRILLDRRKSKNMRTAAGRLLVKAIVSDPIAGADPHRSRRLMYRYARWSEFKLMTIWLNPANDPDRREGARLRLKLWP